MGARLGGAFALLALALFVLGACGGGEGRVLTTQEYADALVEMVGRLAEEAAADPEDGVDRAERLAANIEAIYTTDFESLSAKEAERLLQDLMDSIVERYRGVLELVASVLTGYRDGLMSIRPPEHLQSKHDALNEKLADYAEELRRAAAELEEIARRMVESRDVSLFGEFYETFAAALDAASEPACLDLQETLEEETGNIMSICISLGSEVIP